MLPADIILKNANVITLDSAWSSARLVSITGDRIMAVANDDALDAVPGSKTKVIDCQGRTVLPGFNDTHLHFFSLVQKLLDIDLSPAAVRSIADIKEAIRLQATHTPLGTWLRGTGYNEFYLAEKRHPTRQDLDEAAPDHPVIISHRSLHACVLNSRALALTGIDDQTPELPGARIERDLSTGEPNGILLEMLGYIHEKVLPPLSEAEFASGAERANEMFLSYGIISFQEATYTNSLNRWQTVRDLQDSDRLCSRVTLMTGPATYQEFQEIGMCSGSGDDRLKLGAVKFMPEAWPKQDEMNSAVLECHRAGFQLAFHAVTESQIETAIRGLEYANSHAKVAGRRHRIEHCGECPPALLKRIKNLGCIIVTQPPFIYYSGERYLATVTQSQLPWLYRIKTPLESGITVAGSSDTPVVPCNPLVGVYAAVTRRAASGQTLLPEEAISARQALALYTVNAAYASSEEDIKGSIAPGKLADIIVLNDDPTRAPPDKIIDIKVEMTIIGGKVVWKRAGSGLNPSPR